MTSQIYNRFDPAKNYNRHLFRADKVLQSAELNELQSSVHQRLRGVADVLFKEGDIVRQAGINVNRDTGATTCESGALYLDGAVRGVPPASFTIAVLGIVHVGVYLLRTTITELEDPALRNPAAGTRGYQEAGAARERIDITWGFHGDGQPGDFFPVWTVEDGIVQHKDVPPNLDMVTQAIARYDRDSAGGTYIVRGLELVAAPDLNSGEQVYILGEGAARVLGKNLELSASRRLVYNAQPDLDFVDSEPHQSAGTATQRFTFGRTPVSGTPTVRYTARKTVTLAHGGFSGAADPLPDASVIVVEQVKQGATIYAAPADYKLAAGQIDWSPEGAEPIPGSSYEVTYLYIRTHAADDVRGDSFAVTGALAATQVLVSYHHALRRYDRLCIDAQGRVEWIRGNPSPWSPTRPAVPGHMLALASVMQTWDARRRVIADGVRVVPMDELADHRATLDAILEDQAEIRLAVDIAGRHSGIKKGLFADPMLGNGMRDAGVPQTAAILGGALRLPMTVAVTQIGQAISERQSPAHTHLAVLSQPLRTGSMKVNPYSAFDPLPADVVLAPSIDRWVQTLDQWSPTIQTVFLRWGDTRGDNLADDEVIRETRESVRGTRTAEFLRQIDVEFTLGFKSGETILSLTFDGLPITAQPIGSGTLVANTQGRLRGKFTVPANVPAGTKLVEFVGDKGSRGTALFTGTGTVIERELQQVLLRLPPRQPVDPLAQTFMVDRPRHITGADLWFTARGTTDAMVQLREAEAGFPTQRVVAERRVSPTQMLLGGAATRVTWPPVLLTPEREYALVALSDDATTALAVAELGAWDNTAQRWVTSQPYQVGVLLSSSNASTWTPHQDRDLAFSLLAADYTETERTIDLGSAQVTDATELLVQAMVHQPSAACSALMVLTLDDASQYTVAPGQPAQLPLRYTGAVQVQARLRGDSTLAATLEPGVQLLAASLQTSGTYVSPFITAGGSVRVRVLFQADLPAGSAVQVHAQDDAGGAWTLVPFQETLGATVGSVELAHELANFNAARLRVRLTLTGSHTARPVLRNLRVVVL